METTTPVSHTLNFTGVLSTSKNIISARYSHFITLSLLFLPLSFSLVTTPTLRRRLLPDQPPFTGDTSNHQKLLISYLIYTVIIHIFSLSAIATITYTTHHAFSGNPVKIVNAFKSLIFTFFPVAFTAVLIYILLFFISIIFLLFVGTVLMLVLKLGFVIDYNNSIYFTLFSAIVCVILIAIIINFHVNWSLAFAVVVVESNWGFRALNRSAYLVKGMRSVCLKVMLYFGVCGGGIVWTCSSDLHAVPVTMLGLFFLMIISLRVTAANAVLYNYCKAVHGELAIEVADEGFDHEYVNLPADDAKVPHVVSVVVA